jgi:hypothetical protein
MFGLRLPELLIILVVRVLLFAQTVMRIFELKAFEPGRSLTMVNTTCRGGRSQFGEVWVSYVIRTAARDRVRLVAEVLVRYPRGAIG